VRRSALAGRQGSEQEFPDGAGGVREGSEGEEDLGEMALVGEFEFADGGILGLRLGLLLR
jgi:hypothetical protein